MSEMQKRIGRIKSKIQELEKEHGTFLVKEAMKEILKDLEGGME